MVKYPEVIARQARAIVEQELYRLGFPPTFEFNEAVEILGAAVAFWGERMNLTAAPEDPDELAFHILDSMMPLVLAATRADSAPIRGAFASGRRVLDLGSGAGFPALVLAALAGADFTLLEARRKRVSFLTVAAAEMGLRNVTVESFRADPSSLEPSFDTVIARAFANPGEFYAVAAAALKPGGIAILYATRTQPLELEQARSAGLSRYGRIEYYVPHGEQPAARALVFHFR